MTNLQVWVCVENNVVMMTASTPALKPLFGRKSEQGSSFRSYDNTYELRGTGPSGMGTSAGWSKSRTNRKSNSGITMAHGDTQSEEHILAADQDLSKITKTTNVHVSYGNS